MADHPHTSRIRIVPRGEGLRIKTLGRHRAWHGDLYVKMLDISWYTLVGLIALAYLVINLLFACAYLVSGGIENAHPGSFADAFFFSVQTMSTIGYGKLSPVSMAANLLVTLEALMGFGYFAVITGIVFAKFSRPTARVMWSDVAVVAPYNGVPHLMLRLANERGNRIVDANIHMVVLKKDVSKEGHNMRRFHDLQTTRSRVPLLGITWTVMHPIDEKSPLFGMTHEKLCDCDAEIIVSLTGLDETLAQTIHSRYSYMAEDIQFGVMFEDILKREGDYLTVDYKRFHSTKPL